MYFVAINSVVGAYFNLLFIFCLKMTNRVVMTKPLFALKCRLQFNILLCMFTICPLISYILCISYFAFSVDAAMAAAFPYRGVPGTMPPGVPPPPPAAAPIPDYMTEEKLQEKGECVCLRCILFHHSIQLKRKLCFGCLMMPFLCSPQMAAAAGKALLGEEEIWLCRHPERGHAT